MKIRILLLVFLFTALDSRIAYPEEEAVPACSAKCSTDYSDGFNATSFELVKTVVEDGRLVFQEKKQVVDPENIVVSFTQEVFVSFVYEGTENVSDFGWMLYNDASNPDGSFKGWNNIPQDRKHPLFVKIRDDDEQGGCCGGGNGVLDSDYANRGFPLFDEGALAAYDDGTGYPFVVDGNGIVTAKDMTKSLGTIAGGTEIVFFLTTNRPWTTSDTKGVFFTKKAWNPDSYNACGSGTFIKEYYLDTVLDNEDCATNSGWLSLPAFDRINALIGINLSGTYTLPITWGEKYSHVIAAASQDTPNQWVLGWEDSIDGGDADHNDMVFRVEQRNGGIARLQSNNALIPSAEDGHITVVTFEVFDNLPCSGKTDITYYLSIDNGANWSEVSGWDMVKTYSMVQEKPVFSPEPNVVTGWAPGSPQYTYRSCRVNLSEWGLTGRTLTWKAEFGSKTSTCIPEIVDVRISANVEKHGYFSHASPVVQANVLYSGYCETPLTSWTDKRQRGHLVAARRYDPVDPGSTEEAVLWDAGEALNRRNPANRKIIFPGPLVTRVPEMVLATGDGKTTTFSGILNHPVVATTVRITAQRETFCDVNNQDLKGNFGGTGTINRFSGAVEVVFDEPPESGVPIKCNYSYYNVGSSLIEFNNTNVDNNVLALDDLRIVPGGYVYDLDGNGSIDEQDGDWLVQWVRGYGDGSSKKKEWLLGPVDRSVPAVATPPGRPHWYYGTDITDEEKHLFDLFVTANEERQAVLYVGAGDGMLHAFDAGKFYWGDNAETLVEEKRGFFKWVDLSVDLSFKQQWDSLLNHYLSPPPEFRWQSNKTGEKAPDYGSGEELWAFIPPNLLSRLKNNLLKKGFPASLDASPVIGDVYTNGAWRTVLLSGEGSGGDRVFCLDITDPDCPLFLWEFADPDLFTSLSSLSTASIGRIVLGGTKRWVAFLGSGRNYDMARDPSIYIIDMADGSVVQRVFLHAGIDNNGDHIDDGAGGVPGGQPAIIDSDGNGYVDRMYIGTDKGFVFKINIPDDPKMPHHSIDQCLINTDFFYEDDEGFTHFVPVDQQYQPIYSSPTIIVDNDFNDSGEIEYNIRIFFGTGDSPYINENIDTADTTYSFFAYSDKNNKGECNPLFVSLNWHKALPKGHRMFSSAFVAAGTVYFGTSSSETEDFCAENSEGSIYALDIKNGKVIHQEKVGNITSSPLVEDEHIYFKTNISGGKAPIVMGGGHYNNDTMKSPDAQNGVQSWKEIW